MALQDFSFTAPDGETTVLIGPSGCGKSTSLRLIIGLNTPDSGTVSVGGESVANKDRYELRRKMGYVIQEGGLFPHLTAWENVTIMAQYLDWTRKAVSERLEELREMTGLEEGLLSSYPGELSGGQRQRVSLMRGLFLDPDALLLDEPLGALDPVIRRRMQEDLREIFRKMNKTVLLVTHDMDEAAFFGDRIVLMKNGQKVQEGSLETLLNEPATPFVNEFISAQRSVLAEMEEEL